MLFTTTDYLAFFAAVFVVYWLIASPPVRRGLLLLQRSTSGHGPPFTRAPVRWLLSTRGLQNLLLLVASYVFYGWIHRWFCFLIATSTVVDYFCGLGMARRPDRKGWFLLASLVCNLGMLGAFKYFGFFYENVSALLTALGWHPGALALHIILPVGISFYTFQTLSYTIDIYRGELEPRRNPVDFAVFVAFFPQLVAGPIERARRLLPQVEAPRRWSFDVFLSAWPLILLGYVKKMVVADNIAVHVDRIYMLQHPPLVVLAVGTLAFAIQICADFSGYTDIARGCARLLGFHLMENFRAPYLAVSPSDFWRRWHISFSTWIRDYLYIPLGGSRVRTAWQFALVLFVTLGLSGLWHGAQWHFVAWGGYWAAVLFVFHRLGLAGRWSPNGVPQRIAAWAATFSITLVGWAIFRAPDIGWLAGILRDPLQGSGVAARLAAACIAGSVLVYSLPLLVTALIRWLAPDIALIRAVVNGLLLASLVLLARTGANDFIYFQF